MKLLLSLFLLTVASGLAYTPVQVGPNGCKFHPGDPGGVTPLVSLTCTFPGNVGAGNVLVVGVHSRVYVGTGGATGVTSITDSLGTGTGTDYSLLVSSPNVVTVVNGTWLYARKVGNVGGPVTVTVTLNGTYYFGWLTMAEYDGTQVTTATAGTWSNSGTASAAPTCGTFTPSQPNVQIVAAIYLNSAANGVMTPAAPMISRVFGQYLVERKALLQDYFTGDPAVLIEPKATDPAGSAVPWSCAAVALQSVSASPPTLSGISPNSGMVGTNVPVTLTGTNLTGATAISAGAGITVSGLAVVNATTVTATFAIAAGATPGAQNVTITTPGGTSGSVVFTITSAPTRRRQPIQSSGVGWPAAIAPSADFSLVWFSDQHPNSSGLPWSNTATYALSKLSPWNIKAFAFTGDVMSSPGETLAAFGTQGWNSIVATGLPTIACQVNHDCVPEGCTQREISLSSALWDQYVGYQKIAGAVYGPVTAFSGIGADVGVWTDPLGSKANHAIRFAVNGHKFLAIALEMFPRPEPMAWAAGLAAYYPDHKVIWVNHAALTQGGYFCTSADAYCAQSGGYTAFPTTGQQLYDGLMKLQANSFLAISGHFPEAYPTTYSRRLSTGTNDNPIFSFYEDYQNYTNDAVVRFLFHEQTQTFDCYIMSVTSDTVSYSWLGMAWPQ
jgi:hypothetical protein